MSVIAPDRRYAFAALTAASPHLDDAIAMFARTWDRPLEPAREFFQQQMQQPGLLGYVALDNGNVVALGFGTACRRGQWWYDTVARQVGETHPALQDAWVLVELAVADSHRGKGLGGYLHDRLLAEQPHPRALLSTQVGNYVARRMYEARGWRYLHPGFSFLPGQQPYVVMSHEGLAPPHS